MFEKQADELDKEAGWQVSPASLKASICKADLKLFKAAESVLASTIEGITEEQWISALAKKVKGTEMVKEFIL